MYKSQTLFNILNLYSNQYIFSGQVEKEKEKKKKLRWLSFLMGYNTIWKDVSQTHFIHIKWKFPVIRHRLSFSFLHLKFLYYYEKLSIVLQLHVSANANSRIIIVYSSCPYLNLIEFTLRNCYFFCWNKPSSRNNFFLN